MFPDRRIGTLLVLLTATVLVAAPKARALQVREIALPTNDVVYNPADGYLYASVPSTSPIAPNSIARIQPATGAITGSVPVGSEPRDLAISDDGVTLYVGLDGAGAVRRVNLSTMTAGIQFTMGTDSFLGQLYAEDIEVQPGNPDVIVVSLRNQGYSPRHMGVAVFDNGVKRALVTPTHTGSNVIAFGATSTRVYGYNNETTEFGFRRMTVSPDGIVVQDVTDGIITGFSSDIEFLGGRIYASTGVVIDAEARTPLGTFSLSGGYGNGVVAPTTGNIYFAVGTYGYPGSTSLEIFDPTTFVAVDRYTLPVTGQPSTLRAAGANRFALRTDGGAHFYVLSNTNEAPSCDLALSLAGTPDPAITGSPMSYVSTISNLGDAPGSDVTLRQQLPAGTSLSTYSTPRGYCYDSLGTVVCTLGSMSAHDSLSVTVWIVTPGGTSMESRAAVSTSNRDANPANNQAAVTTRIRPAGFDHIDVALRFASPPDTNFISGRPVHHSLEITNRGPADASNVQLAGFAYGAGSVTFTSADLSCAGDTSGGGCQIPILRVGQVVHATATVVPGPPGFMEVSYSAIGAEIDNDYSNNSLLVFGPVRPAAESLLVGLIQSIQQLGLHPGPEKQLTQTLRDALQTLAAGDTSAVCTDLETFQQRLDQRAGRGLTIAQAYRLSAVTAVIQTVLGCVPPPASDARVRGPGATRGATSAAAGRDGTGDPAAEGVWPLAIQPVSDGARWSVRLSMPSEGRAKVEVIDVQGRVVTTLFDGTLKAGARSFAWDDPAAARVPSGVYFLRLTALGQQRVAKASMLR